MSSLSLICHYVARIDFNLIIEVFPKVIYAHSVRLFLLYTSRGNKKGAFWPLSYTNLKN